MKTIRRLGSEQLEARTLLASTSLDIFGTTAIQTELADLDQTLIEVLPDLESIADSVPTVLGGTGSPTDSASSVCQVVQANSESHQRNAILQREFGTTMGDANLDGHFDHRDLQHIHASRLHESATGEAATWQTGDWNCDGRFNSSDLVEAFSVSEFSTNLADIELASAVDKDNSSNDDTNDSSTDAHGKDAGQRKLATIVDVRDCGNDYPTGIAPPNEGCADIDNGYTTRWSYDQGDVVDFHLSGLGNYVQEDVYATIYDAANQPYMTFEIPRLEPQTMREDQPWTYGFGYEVTTSVQLPESMPSGVYFLGKAGPSIATGGKQIPFIVRRASKQSDIVVLHGTNTANAYSATGGAGNYSNPRPAPDPLLSFQRPKNHNHRARPLIKWFAQRQDQFDHRFISNTDMEHYDQLAGSRLLVIGGHSEYWSQTQVDHLNRFVDEGGSLLVLGGNVMFKEARYCYADNRESNTPCADIAESYIGDPDNDEPIALRFYNTERPNIPRPAPHDKVPAPRNFEEVRQSIGLSYEWGKRGFNACTPARNNYEFDNSISGCSSWVRLPKRGNGGYKFVTADRPYLEGVELPKLTDRSVDGTYEVEYANGQPVLESINRGDVLNMWNSEYDGFPNNGLDTFPEGDSILRAEYDEIPEEAFLTGYPLIQQDYLDGFHEFHLIGFEFGFRSNLTANYRHLRLGGWIEFQRTPDSGRVINTGASDWGNISFSSCDNLKLDRGTCAYKHGHQIQEITANMIDYLLSSNSQAGDFNKDGRLGTEDIDALTNAIHSGENDPAFDLNDDQKVDNFDRLTWIQEIAETSFGDSNLDGMFESKDLVLVFSEGLYDTGKPANWRSGDWNGDGRFDSSDLVSAFQHGAYQA